MLHYSEVAHFSVTRRTQRAPYGEVHVTMPDGGVLVPRVVHGRTLADTLIAFGVPLRSETDGVGSVTHIRVAAHWMARLPVPNVAEQQALRRIAGAGPTSRLASQIVMTPALDGLEIEIDAHSVAPQAWAAG